MLDLLRRRASSWLIKAMLAVIVLSFALYFGYTQIEYQRQRSKQSIAVVGDTVIPRQTFDVFLENNLSQLRQSSREELPENFETFLKQNLLQQLVAQEVAHLYALSLGIRVPDKKVAEAIQENSMFVKNGVFDYEFYHNNYRPYFNKRFGEDFEKVVKKELALNYLSRLSSLCYDPWEGVLRQSNREEKNLSSSQILSRWIEHFREQTKIQIYPDTV
ncbi:MAG: SurA N-terminal domain-containing protein [Deltaproteobacteria bacterium]|nr:SurA N-terminal domain-containing protein [Deltaproteobacteria bacterium]